MCVYGTLAVVIMTITCNGNDDSMTITHLVNCLLLQKYNIIRSNSEAVGIGMNGLWRESSQ